PMLIFLQQLINGLTTGTLFALIALGYTMVYGIIELINFAHGDLFMLGSFLALQVALWVGVAAGGGRPGGGGRGGPGGGRGRHWPDARLRPRLLCRAQRRHRPGRLPASAARPESRRGGI